MSSANIRVAPIRGTADVMTRHNIVLMAGEVGYETDTKKTKLGDGVSAWNALPYSGSSATNLGSAATHAATDFDLAGSAAAVATSVAATSLALMASATKSDVRRIVTNGDSIVAGNNFSDGASWPADLGTALGANVTVTNLAHGGWTSTEVAVLQGGRTVTLGAFTLPADTSNVAVTITAPTADFRAPNTGVFFDAAGTLTFGGTTIAGGLHRDTSGWHFARTTAGSSISVPAGAVFTGTDQNAYRDAVQMFGVGRNNVFDSNTDTTTPVADIAAMVAHLTPDIKRYLVTGITTTTTETTGNGGYIAVTTINQALAAAHGNRFVDVRRYLIDHGLTLAGITPTTADTTAIAGDTIPPSLMHSDGTHPTPAGQAAIAQCILNQLIALDWVKDKPSAVTIPATSALAAYQWRADDLTGADGTAVASWSDHLAGLAMDQSTTADQPVLATVSTKKYVRFDGSNDQMGAFFGNETQPFTYAIRARFRSLSSQPGNQYVLWPNNAGASMFVATNGTASIGSSNSSSSGLVSSATGAVAADTDVVIVGVYNGISSKISVNGGTPVTGTLVDTSAASDMVGLTIGVGYDGVAVRNAAIDVREVRVYNSALANSDITAVAAAMAA